MLNESYKQYRKAAKTVYGEDADDKIHAEMAKDAMVSTYDWGYQVYNMDMDSDSERLLFYDLASKKYFRTTMAAVLNAQYHVNRNLSVRGVCPLNEYLSFLGLDEVDGGDVIGWDICYMIEEMDCYWLDFDNHKTTLEDGLECIIKTIGIAVTVIGFGVNILTDWVNEKKMDERIEEKVNEALAKRDSENEEES